MHPNLPQIQHAEHNRNARMQDAEAHRLLVEAGVYDHEGATRRQIVKIAISGVKHLIQSMKSIRTQAEKNAKAEMNASA